MFDSNALTDAIGMTIAATFALQSALGSGISALVGLAPVHPASGWARWIAAGAGALLGALLGLVASQGDGDARWIAIGGLAGLLVGIAEGRGAARERDFTESNLACRACPCCGAGGRPDPRPEAAG